MAHTLIIVDDELDIQSSLSFALEDEGYEVITASTPKEALERLQENEVDVGLFDIWFPEGDGIELLKECSELYPDMGVVMMSGHGNIELALKSIRLGAYDFLEKPLELEKVLVVLKNAVESRRLRDENTRLMEQIVLRGQLVGRSREIQNLKNSIERVAKAPSPLYISGESGVGKELVARLVHKLSQRRSKPFVPVKCVGVVGEELRAQLFGYEKGALPQADRRFIGSLEQASEGTVYLDEISGLSPELQSQLLKTLEEGCFHRIGGSQKIPLDCRVISSSSVEVKTLKQEKKLSEELFMRLNILSLPVPALRNREEDVVDLAEYFLKIMGGEYQGESRILGEDLKNWMNQYDWPGNVRELKNLIERMLIFSPQSRILGLRDLPDELQGQAALQQGASCSLIDFGKLGLLEGSLRDLRAKFEKTLLEQRLQEMEGNVTKTAESLGVERAHLHRKLRQFGIAAERKEL